MASVEPQDIEFAETAPVIAEGSVVVDGTPAEVWAVLADHARWPEWFGGAVKTVTPTSDPPGGVGATRVVVLRGGRVDERFITWDELTTWAFTATEIKPPFASKLVERAVVEPIDDAHTRVTYRMAVELVPLLKPLAPLVRKGLGRAITQGMQGLARQVVALRA
jgi:carbon monoxide dehydrogenase subunit G